MNIRLHEFWHGRCPLLGPSLYVWVQGCPRRCQGCFNQEALDNAKESLMLTPESLASIWQRQMGGIVLSGGEPFSQANSLAEFCRHVRTMDTDVPILVYTGYLIQQLFQAGQSDWLELLQLVDVLVDGPYVQSRPSDHPLMGSDNQRIFLLGKRIPKSRLEALDRAQIQVSLTLDGQLRLVGTGSAGKNMHMLLADLKHQVLIMETTNEHALD